MTNRMPDDMSNKMAANIYIYIFQNKCQIKRESICQIECQVERQIEC